jgi:NAD(P)-dependent dehydrogenase (short-subunit alcohol dehydrogenase family)
MTNVSRTWFVTGVSGGLGRAIAVAALEAGDTVVGTLRKPEQFAEFEALAPGRAHALALDVTDSAAVGPAIEEAIRLTGGVDVVVNNAGYGLVGALEELTEAEAQKLMDTNFFGVFRVTKAFVPHLKSRGGGAIINVGSVASARGFPSMSMYSASKFAVTGFSQAMAHELAPFAIRVTVVEPGGFRTNFGSGGMAWAANPLPDYDRSTQRFRESMERPATPAPNDPARGAQVILALAAMDKPPVHMALGADGRSYVKNAINTRLADYDLHVELAESTAYPD